MSGSMDAGKARKIVDEFEQQGVTEMTLDEAVMARVAEYDRASTYLAALEGPEVKVLLDKLNHFAHHAKTVSQQCDANAALMEFQKALGK